MFSAIRLKGEKKMAIKKVRVTDDVITLWVIEENNAILIRRNDGKPLDKIDSRVADLYDFYKHLMDDPSSVNPDLEEFIREKDYFDGTFTTITVYPCGHYTVRYERAKKSKRFFLWEKFFKVDKGGKI